MHILLEQLETLLRHGKIHEGLHSLKDLQKSFQKYAEFWRIKGELLLFAKEKAKGINSLRISHKLSPASPWYLGCLANGYSKINNTTKSKKIAQEVLQLSCVTAYDHLGRSFAERILNNYEESYYTIEEAVQLDPSNIRILNVCGHTHFNLKYFRQALAIHNKVINLDIQHIAAWNGKGNALNGLQRYEEALEAYDKAITLDPEYVYAWNGKGNALNNLKRYGEALEAYDKVIILDPEYVYAWNGKGNALNNLKRYGEALEAYDKVIILDPEYVYAWNGKGNALNNLKRYGEALEAYDKVIILDPEYVYAWNGKGNTLNNLKRYGEALEVYDRAITIDPEYIYAWNGKGKTLNNLKQYGKALEAYDKAITIDPENVYAWNGRGNALNGLKRYGEALEAYDRAITIDPEYVYAWNGKGNALNNLKRYGEALEAYDRAITIDPEYVYVWNGRGNALNGLKRYGEALEAYDRALTIDPEYVYAWNGRGNALNGLNRYKEALEAYDKALTIDPEYVYAWNGRGNALNGLNRYKEALEAYDKALTIDPELAYAWNGKGNALNNLKRSGDALEAYDRAIKCDPQYNPPYYNKSLTLRELNRLDEAIKLLDTACKINLNDSAPLKLKSDILRDQKKYTEALSCCERALELNSHDYLAWRIKGQIFEELHSYKKAIDAYAESSRFAGQHVSSSVYKDRIIETIRPLYNTTDIHKLLEYGQIELEYGSIDFALKNFKTAASIEIPPGQAHYLLGVAQYRDGNYEKSLDLFNKVLSTTPDSTTLFYETLIAKISTLIAQQNLQEASTLLDKIISNKKYTNTAHIEKIKKEIDVARNIQIKVEHLSTNKLSKHTSADSKHYPEQEPIKLSNKSQTITINDVLDIVKSQKDAVQEILNDMEKVLEARSEFLFPSPSSLENCSYFLVLRRWNSYTPILPVRDSDERSLGGGYYIRHDNFGIVIDPGLNFIENFSNAGLRMADINAIIITHAHNDHTAELEALLTMSHKLNKDKSRETILATNSGIELYINLGCFKKFSGVIDLNAKYIKTIKCISPGDKLQFSSDKFFVEILPAYHDELISFNHAVGLKFLLKFNNEITDKRILLTSDTSLFPQQINSGSEPKSNIAMPEIWTQYGVSPSEHDIDLLIAHLGSIKDYEFEDKNIPERLYPNHLGMIGVIRIISMLQPKLSIISEFGEEFAKKKLKITKLIRESTDKLSPGSIKPYVLAADIGFEYNIMTSALFCLTPDYTTLDDGGGLNDFREVITLNDNKRLCYCKNNFYEPDEDGNCHSTGDALKRWETARKSRYAWYLNDYTDKTYQDERSGDQPTDQATTP